MKKLSLSLLLLLSFVSSFAKPARIDEIVRLREVADSLHAVGRTDSAKIVGEQAVRLAVESGDPTQIVGTHAAQGVFLRSLGMIDEALESYGAALEIVTSGKFRQNPDSEAIEEIASLYINLAVLNLDMQHKEQAAENAVSAAIWVSKSGDAALRATVYGVVGSVLTGCGDLSQALHYQDLAYNDAMSAGNTEAAFRSAAYTMLIADRLGKKALARDRREICNVLIDSVPSTMAKLAYYQAECSICLSGGDTAGSLLWFNKILATDGIDNLPFVKFDCYNNMHTAYADLGDYHSAYNTVLQNMALRDSLWEQEKAESLRDLTVKYETKETELALAQSEARRSTTLMWLFASIVGLLIAVTAFVVYATRQRRQRLQREIEFANLRADIGRQLTEQYVEGLENERQRMSRELHDGVCNDLLAIQMNMSTGTSIEETTRLIDNCRESVRRISHELMPPEFAYASIDEVVRFFVNKQHEANSGKIELLYTSSTDSSWNSVPDAVSLEIYRIIQEAVGNAVKHSGATEINVSLVMKDSVVEADIRDNGTYNPSGRKGIGLDSIRRRAKAIDAQLVFSPSDGEGTRIHLRVTLS